ncbi:11020_t:CDS:2, partial [Funneliformis mosseae]
KKTGILPEVREILNDDSVFSDNSLDIEINELEMLISLLLNNDLNKEDIVNENEFTPILEKVTSIKVEEL